MRVVIRVSKEELTRNLPRPFLSPIESKSPRTIEFGVSTMTRPRCVARNGIGQVGAQAHVLSQQPRYPRTETLGAVDAARLFIRRAFCAEIEVEIELAGRVDTKSSRIDQHCLIGAFAPGLLIILK